jgi:hypothetical protein
MTRCELRRLERIPKLSLDAAYDRWLERLVGRLYNPGRDLNLRLPLRSVLELLKVIGHKSRVTKTATHCME